MAWLRSAFQGVSSWLALGEAAAYATPRSDALECVRAAMLGALTSVDGTPTRPLAVRMRFAQDATALWYLRSELMGALCQAQGERAARAALDRITPLFKGLMPGPLLQAGAQAGARRPARL